MNPIHWTDRCVRLACGVCGAHTLVELERYVSAVGRRVQIECGTCGGLEPARDRRRFDRPVERERRGSALAA